MEDISLHVLDIAENSLASGATLITISIAEKTEEDSFIVSIEDNGTGMPEEFVKNVLDPFCTTRTTRKAGLGLSLLAQSARETGGDITVRSVTGKGTLVRAVFHPSHIDMKPNGNIPATIITLITGNPQVDFIFTCSKNNRAYTLDTKLLRQALEDVPINTMDVLSAIKNDLIEALHDISL
jgi:hypothetical protein